ncbi:aldehyde dehydrogenase [Sphingomonas sp. Root710]|uniref:aldehyde dehydrogenase family protein n=1 Tax=Sphingomonas sp. Root710 TaxID=1736594 RepID=UPI0007008006|nr:aldehyde dehydrogenase family protein [Sphingomonas sp. Root710]KRB85537.1 aldehyde dehydrogenase [Sphingomonas sp. Root710]
MEEFKMLIGGRLVDGASSIDVINPASEDVVAACPRATEAQLDDAVAAAKAAFPAWAATPIDERKDYLLKIADAIDVNSAELARLQTLEQGKPLAASQGDVAAMAAFFRYFTTLDLPAKVIEDSPASRIELHRKPLGVIGAIIPWNYPLIIVAFKVPPALLAGNTVVLKPAPTTPLATLRFGEIIRDILPAGVINIITDANDLGDALTRHPDVRKISFTGSTATGIKVMAGAAGTLKRLTLELGGNDAGIVLDDADPKKIAPAIFNAAFQNSGQTCIALKRLYVHDSIYDQMCAELAQLADGAVVGDGLEQGTQFGPLQNKMQFDRALAFLEEGRRHGKVIGGGAVPDRPGYFMQPTIISDIADGNRLVDEEQFSPILPVIKFSDPEDALARANASPFGLGGSIWSADTKRAYEFAVRMESGAAWINQHMAVGPNIPAAGAKQSGIGVEFGDEGLAEFTQIQVVNIAQ